jgi:glycoprotein-N-acetylgalactosamine 3-beta-galactosyltransferase
MKKCPSKGWGWEPLINNLRVWQGAKKGTPRIFCMVYTMSGTGGVHNIPRSPQHKAQFLTWSGSCDKFLFFTDKELHQDYPHYVIKPLKGGESYGNMWQKTRAILQYAYKNHVDDYDYFTVGGDDVYYIVENLRRLLHREDIASQHVAGKPLYLGRKMDFAGTGQWFNTGGASYVLNSHALRLYGENMHLPRCFPTMTTSAEDVQISKCLHSLGVDPFDTRELDESSGYFHAEHFFPLTADAVYIYRKGSWGPAGWFDKYTKDMDLQVGLKCCSPYTITFHYVDEGTMLWMDKFLRSEECRPTKQGDGAKTHIK